MAVTGRTGCSRLGPTRRGPCSMVEGTGLELFAELLLGFRYGWVARLLRRHDRSHLSAQRKTSHRRGHEHVQTRVYACAPQRV